ncbi:MAG: helix-turn-helix domain-containing protein [Psychrobacter sp.]|uniref:helix-turn-helix domain-containing protein n=1 Tax=Psychrobacter sp. TaxID=56811 RepID=UPI0026493B6A|nr:helix-turn-helix transcriptional regulator [Psychrobacter sp.]MDN5619263.1 helix-turn-helix domain-containing protein [Psychrobacter sp.]
MNRQEIGNRLKNAREDCAYSRNRVAAEVGIGTTTLQQWETGTREASIETIGKLADLYSVTPQYLIFGDTDTQTHHAQASDIAAISAAQGISVEEAIDTLKAMIQDTHPKLTEEEAFLLKEFQALDDDQRRMMLRFIIGGFDSLNSGGGNKGIFSSPHAKIEDSFKG